MSEARKADLTGLPVAVAAVIRRGDGRYLIIRRAEGRPAAGYWAPVTGRVEPGESLAAAVEREVQEEVGLAVRAGREVHRCPTDDGRWLLVWLDAEILEERALVLDASEVADARWLSAEEAIALEPMFPATRAFFEARRRA